MCRAMMQCLMLAEFRHRLIVSILLNIYLFEHHVPLAVHKKVVKRVDTLEKKVDSLIIKVDGLV